MESSRDLYRRAQEYVAEFGYLAPRVLFEKAEAANDLGDRLAAENWLVISEFAEAELEMLTPGTTIH